MVICEERERVVPSREVVVGIRQDLLFVVAHGFEPSTHQTVPVVGWYHELTLHFKTGWWWEIRLIFL